jgi:hypothetical protein
MISEILGMIYETHKEKDWLLRQIRQIKPKLKVKRSMTVLDTLNICTDDLLLRLSDILNDPFDPSVEIPVLTRVYHWFFTDIVGSSDPLILTKDQARKVWVLNELVGRTETFKKWNHKSDVMTITGDGMVIGFSDTIEKPLSLAKELHKLISNYNVKHPIKDKIKIRIGIESGPVYFVKDLSGKDNFWGPGIIMARRVMDIARSMQILTTENVSNQVRKLSQEYKSIMHETAVYTTKHGERLKIYNVFGPGFGNRLPPNEVEPEPDHTSPAFSFPKIELKIDISETKTWMTHHTWVWKVVNITEKPIDLVSYYLMGDVPRDFVDLGVTVRDSRNKKIKVANILVNKSQEKHFVVRLQKPVKPNKCETLKMEYDWEEPERNFSYTFATACKNFRFTCTVPKKLEIEPMVLKVLPTKDKILAHNNAGVRYLRNSTEITWQANNLEAHEQYEFRW